MAENQQGRSGVSTVNLNALTADSVQLDYLAKEQEAAAKLLQLQTKNAEELARLRLQLLNDLLKETKQRSEEVETDLAEFRHQKALDNLKAELSEIRAQHRQLQAEQQALYQQNIKDIKQAETQLSNFRLSTLKLETTQRLKDIATIEQAELASLRRRLAATPGNTANLRALEEAEGALSTTIQELNNSLEQARADQLAQTEALLRRETELNAESTRPVQPQTTAPTVSAGENSSTSTTGATTPRATSETEGAVAAAETEAELRAEVNKTYFSEAERIETELLNLRLANLSTIHIQRMLDDEKAGKHAITSEVQKAALIQELTERQRDFEEDSLAQLFAERANAEKEKAENLRKAHKKEYEERISQELAILDTLRDSETGQAKYSNDFLSQMYSRSAQLEVEGENGKEIVTKKLSDMSEAELRQIQNAELKKFEAENSEANLRAKAEAEVKASTNYAEGSDEYNQAVNAFFEQLTEAREKDKVALEQEHNQQLEFLKDREDAEKKIAKEQSKFANSKLNNIIASSTNAFQFIKDRNQFAANWANDILAKDPSKTTAQIQAEMQAQLNATFAKLGGYITQLNEKGAQQAKKQGAVDTNLQGSHYGIGGTGAWKILNDLVSVGVGLSPFVRQEDVANQIEKLATMGISYNLKQRAFLNTISEKIATTFDAADGTLRKLVRIQQADSTAARLGMESALTSFLNNMYETSEFMHEAAAEIRGSLYEATALMQAEKAAEYEYQVQKWLGSLYSVGFNASSKVADTLGKITAGDISGVTDGGMSNLLIMAANEANLPIAEILEKGLTPDQTNALMQSMVSYLANIYEETKGSNVLAQQYGNVFGVTAADLKAAANLYAKGLDKIASTNKNYEDMENRLELMANTAIFRTSMAEVMENMKANFEYTMQSTIANNPVLSGLNYMANMLNDLVGGIEIPFVNVYGFGFDLNATVADLMNVAALSGTVMGGMGKLLASLAGGGGMVGSGMLRMFGVDLDGEADKIKSRGGNSLALTAVGGSTTSESGSIAGNESGDDIKNKTLADASEGPEKQIAEAKEDQEDKEEARTNQIVGHIVDIYDLLQEVTLGSKKWHVKLDVGNVPSSWSTGTWT